MFLSFVLINILVAILIKIYLKLTCGICQSSKHLVGKVVIVTGANAGIGFETAKNLAERGAKVILACRNDTRGNIAKEKIIQETGNSDVHYRNLDLSSLRSVRKFSDDILKTESRLDILINNAGSVGFRNTKTEDGLLMGMQVNHFGPFLLTCLLLPLLKSSAPSRIINVSSTAYRGGVIDFQNLNMEKETDKTFSDWKVYRNSKLCNILMAVELSRRLTDTGVTVNSLHPGLVDTNIFEKFPSFFRPLMLLVKVFMKSSWEGAQTTIYLAVSPEVQGMSGSYFSDCRMKNTYKIVANEELARKLWNESERLVKLDQIS